MAKTVPSILRRRETRSLPANYGYSGFGLASPVLSGVMVNHATAMAFTAVYAAINTISTDVSVLPFNSYERLPNGGKQIVKDSVNELVSTSPDGNMDAVRYWQMQMGHALQIGNGFSEIHRNPRTGEPARLEPLDPRTTKAVKIDKQPMYFTQDDEGSRYILPENVLHFAGLGFDGITGYSPVTLARQAIGLGIAAEEVGASLFGNGALKKGILKLQKTLTPQAMANLRNSINAVHQGPKNAHNFMILEEGMEFVDTQLQADESQFMPLRQFQILEVARIYKIPPHKLGDFSQSHMSNIEESNLDYITRTLVGWLMMIEAQCNLKLYTRADRESLETSHNLWSLIKGNMTARADWYQKMAALGVLTPNDICRLENLNPIGADGDKRLVPLNMTTLAQAGAPAQQKAER